MSTPKYPNASMRSTTPRKDRDPHHGSVYNPDFLKQQARWIRDDLDHQVARDGPDALHSDDVLTLDEFLRRLLTSSISLEDIRFSRLHWAVMSIAGQATRWPKKLIERAETLRDDWAGRYGDLRELATPLYEQGGRLHGICRPEQITREQLMVKWLKDKIKPSPMMARRVGELGFRAGDWWISPVFALRDGIIDSAESNGGIVADVKGAYAILMTKDEEINGLSPDRFTYRARNSDIGRYRLTSATRDSRQPVRILRSHSLRSFWAPKAGIRYDGLHKVTGWSIKPKPGARDMVFEINFKRLPCEPSMDIVLRRPFQDEIEDYMEFKRLRQIARQKQSRDRRKAAPTLTVTTDGSMECIQHERRNALGSSDAESTVKGRSVVTEKGVSVMGFVILRDA